ncbi:ankyrin repeat domain-containing protein 1-like [Ptychodera flava]|uniref:ankyrin repeat domain-containing protein 1-like n=1 Tax=Ptychodera flava TaxID=63121 RepID=UPI00396A729E
MAEGKVSRTKELEQDLFSAVDSGNVEKVNSLLGGGIDVNVVDKIRWTPLHHAVAAKHVDIVNVLIKAKADINARDMFDNTPLHTACQYGEVDIVRVLLTNRPDINARNNVSNIRLIIMTNVRLWQTKQECIEIVKL